MTDGPQHVELLVVGSGPAGLSASLQARRDGIEHLVVGDENPGGLLGAAWRIDNLAGYPAGVTGELLAHKLARQAEQLELPVTRDRVADITIEAGRFVSTLESARVVTSQTLILATGTRPRPWGPPGAEEISARGRLHRDVRSLPAHLDGHTVIVIGAGDAAFDSALSIHRRAGRAIVLARGDTSKANTRILERIRKRDIEVRRSCPVDEVKLENDAVAILAPGLRASHLLVCIGREADDELYRRLVPEEPLLEDIETPLAGLFVAGDLVAGRNRFIASAFGQGQRATLEAARWMTRRKAPSIIQG